MSDLRPTLFLAQLSNLLAGNISIVHGVTGSSRTFMGEGIGGRRCGPHRAVAHRGGPKQHCRLVGGSHNSERPDLLMLYEFGGFALKDKFVPVWQRVQANPDLRSASRSARSLVIESRAARRARGAKRIAKAERRCSPTARGEIPAT